MIIVEIARCFLPISLRRAGFAGRFGAVDCGLARLRREMLSER